MTQPSPEGAGHSEAVVEALAAEVDSDRAGAAVGVDVGLLEGTQVEGERGALDGLAGIAAVVVPELQAHQGRQRPREGLLGPAQHEDVGLAAAAVLDVEGQGAALDGCALDDGLPVALGGAAVGEVFGGLGPVATGHERQEEQREVSHGRSISSRTPGYVTHARGFPMDDATLAGLRAALAASPDNLPLLGMILGGLAERENHEEGLRLLGARAPEDLDPKARIAAARLLAQAEERERGLAFYRSAVTAAPPLEDRELEARLSTRPAELPSGKPQLRVLSSGRLEDDGREVETLFDSPQQTISFEDVGGLDDLKKRIRRKVMLPMQKPSLFKRFRKRAGGGVLLYGPPGCGKTLMARATAGECGASFFNVAISDVLDMWFGESEQKLHDIFEKARQSSPSVLFFDEVEAIGGRRRHSQSTSSANLVSQFLSEMDGFDGHNEGVLVLGATNVPWAVDPAFRRPGRFDRVLFVPPPDRAAREAILGIHLAERPLDSDVKVPPLAKKTSGYSGADLEEVVETAADLAIEASIEADAEVPISQAHLLEALAEVRPTTTEWLTTARNYARYANEGGQYDEVLDFLSKHGKR